MSAGFLSLTYFPIYKFLFFRHWDFLSLVWTWWWGEGRPFSGASLSLKELPAPLGSRVPWVHLSEQGYFRSDRLSHTPGASPLSFPSPGIHWSPFSSQPQRDQL